MTRGGLVAALDESGSAKRARFWLTMTANGDASLSRDVKARPATTGIPIVEK